MIKKSSSEIRREIYEALKNSKSGQLRYSELLKIVGVPNTNFAGALQKIGRFYPNIVRVERGLYVLVKNKDLNLKMSLLTELQKILDGINIEDVTGNDYIFVKKIIDLKKELEVEMDE